MKEVRRTIIGGNERKIVVGERRRSEKPLSSDGGRKDRSRHFTTSVGLPTTRQLHLLSLSLSLSLSILGAMEVAGWFVGPIMDKIIKGCFDYLEEQVGWQTGMKKELESLRQNQPKIQAVVFAANQAQISDQNPGLNEWIWQLRDALDEVNDVLDELEYMKHKEQLPKNTEETKVCSAT
ncbi:hypothetical protein IEQ34_001249 [Dendrobium chrysotoxum]|uniref:Disease resistance N-terminal domain-containing protein n=1 Tax=Dendrobium chrysotoxum TaxID=161865 RepID=A0AAV7HL50_DENCH|nr:hypothetical protein IEQ34_001249 [Dendrobium chrysotoxum]